MERIPFQCHDPIFFFLQQRKEVLGKYLAFKALTQNLSSLDAKHHPSLHTRVLLMFYSFLIPSPPEALEAHMQSHPMGVMNLSLLSFPIQRNVLAILSKLRHLVKGSLQEVMV